MNLLKALLVCSLTTATADVAPLRIDGLVSACLTPIDAQGNINISVVPEQAAYNKATGVNWVFVTGTTGESVSLNMDERKSLFDAWIATGTNVIAHVGCDCIGDAKLLAAYAEKAGAKAIGTMPPSFFKPANAQALALTVADICSAAPTLPCYYYHIPSMTGVIIPMLDFVKAIDPLCPNFAGIKYTGLYQTPGFMDAQAVMYYKGGKYEVLSGREEMMLEALSVGIVGHVGSQFNFAGDLYNTLRSEFGQQGLTKANQARLHNLEYQGGNLIRAWQTAPQGTNGNKAFMIFAGVPVGDSRLPYIPLAPADISSLQKQLATFCADPFVTSLKLRICANV